MGFKLRVVFPFDMKRLLLLLCFCPVAALAQPQDAGPRDFLAWNTGAQSRFVTAVCADARGDLWVGTEDKGLWVRDPQGAWSQFTARDGLGDDRVLCLATDLKNRLWAGTARGGVSVWNGRWRSFGVENGPLSERVRDIAIAPRSGEVWLATDAGLARYSDERGWRYITHWDGLASNQIVALAFDATGNLFAASACDGLSIAHPGDDYASWTNVAGAATQPDAPQGAGLPSNYLNDVAVDSAGNVWVASNFGLAKSSDGGAHWFFARGTDWADNVAGSARELKPNYVPLGIEPLAEDWVNKIEPGANGQLWLGFRRKGFELRDADGQLLLGARNAPGANNLDFVDAIWPVESGAVVGSYGQGLQLTSADGRRQPAIATRDARFAAAPAPQAATPSTADEMKALALRLAALPAAAAPATADAVAVVPAAAAPVAVVPDATVPDATIPDTVGADAPANEVPANVPAPNAPGSGGFYGFDWRTQGDWVGRYGDRRCTIYPEIATFSRAGAGYEIGPEEVGPHGDGAGPYTYIYELENSERRVLYHPAVGKRRPAEINDGSWRSEKFPFSWQGPDLWLTLEVPSGTHRAALYFDNFNGHDGINRFRDYVVHLKPYFADLKGADAVPDLAHARVNDFWSGTYAQFWLQGPAKFRVQIERGCSHAAILQGVFLDQIGGPRDESSQQATNWMGGVRYVTQETPAPRDDENQTLRAARALWNAAEQNAPQRGAVEAAWMTRLLAFRAAASAGASPELLANWRWKLAIWNDADHAEFAQTMLTAYAKLTEQRAAANQPLPQ